jgi:hypothetical protein
MKNNITKTVMQEITSFEEQRSKSWIALFWLTILIIMATVIWAAVRTYMILADRQALDLLEIFQQDREIFQEYWQDVLFIFLAELPQRTVIFGAIVLVLLVTYWVVTKQQRARTRRRLLELAKIRKSRNNKRV